MEETKTSQPTENTIKKEKDYKDYDNYDWIEYILDNLDKKWNWEKIAENPNITMEHLMEIDQNILNHHFTNNFISGYEKNTNVNIYTMKKYRNMIWDFDKLSSNPNITPQFVVNNIGKDWNWKTLCENPIFTIESILHYSSINTEFKNKVNYFYLAKNPNITYEIIMAYPELFNTILKVYDRSVGYESYGGYGSYEINRAGKMKNIYHFLSFNPTITWDIISENLDKEWDFHALSGHQNITWEIVEANPEINWDYKILSNNPNITWEIVEANFGKDWSFTELSKNPNITWEIIQNNREYQWNFSAFCENPNITWNILEKYPLNIKNNPNSWLNIAKNPMKHHKYYKFNNEPVFK